MGKVHVWYMTEEERLAYIAKHPIVPTEKPNGTDFATIKEMKCKKGRTKILNNVAEAKIHQMFISGDPLKEIAESVGLSYATVQKFITLERKNDPDKWPRRY
ncbi:hypothetical protein [Bacillus sp. 1P02SD]|uniref:hypothetical protein n=1 Tax=Bacillus sp. 1P02SD TaxID=3132264 RepID=UPI0039A2DFEA